MRAWFSGACAGLSRGVAICGMAGVAALGGEVIMAKIAMGETLRLDFLESHPIHDADAKFTEPSGLAVDPSGEHLWSVSDDTKRVFRLDLAGRIMANESLKLPADGMEGVAVAADGGHLLLVREDGNRIYEVEIATGEITRERRLDDLAGYAALALVFEGSPENKGLEGITVDTRSGNVLVLKEGVPRVIVEISPDLDRILGHAMLNRAAGFTEGHKLDVSGITFDPARQLFWIVTDRERRIYLYDHASGRATGSSLLATIDGRETEVRHAEGVAIDVAAARLYVVTDDGKDSRLFVYAIE